MRCLMKVDRLFEHAAFRNTALIAILLLSAGLRLWDLDGVGIWHDEGVSFDQANRSFLGMIIETAKDNYPPLHNIILWFTIKLFGTSEVALRGPSVIMGVAGVYLIYRLGSFIWTKNTGLIAALILSLSPPHILHSSEARMYALFAMTTIGFIWATLHSWKSTSKQSSLFVGVAAYTMLMSHLFGMFVFASAGGFIIFYSWQKGLLKSTRFRRWFKGQAVAALCFMPSLIVLLLQSSRVVDWGFWVPFPTVGFVLTQLAQLWDAPLRVAFLLLGVLYLRILTRSDNHIITVHIASEQGSDWDPVFLIGILLSCLFGPIAISWLVSITILPILYYKYLICIAPVGILIVSRGITALPDYPSARVMIVVAMAGFMLLRATDVLTNRLTLRHDLRAAGQFLKEHLQTTDRYVPIPQWGYQSIKYYSGTIEKVTYLYHDEQWLQPLAPTSRVVFSFTNDGLDKMDDVIKAYSNAGYEIIESGIFRGASVVVMDPKN